MWADAFAKLRPHLGSLLLVLAVVFTKSATGSVNGTSTGDAAHAVVPEMPGQTNLAFGTASTTSTISLPLHRSLAPSRALVGQGEWTKMGKDIDGLIEQQHGKAVSMSRDGSHVAVLNNYHANVMKWDGASWNQVGSEIGSEEKGSYQNWLWRVSLSKSGSHVAVGGRRYFEEFRGERGLVKVFRWNKAKASWSQMGRDIVAKTIYSNFGEALSLSDDGRQVAIGDYSARVERGRGVGGIVQVWRFSGSLWEQMGETIDGGADYYDLFGSSISMAGDGTSVSIGARYSRNGDKRSTGRVETYKWKKNSWKRIGSPIYGKEAMDHFGYSVATSLNGKRLVAGAYVHGKYRPGYVRVFEQNGSSWDQVGGDIVDIVRLDTDKYTHIFGAYVSMSSNGDRIAIGSPIRNAFPRGHVQIFGCHNASWKQLGSDLIKEDFDSSLSLLSMDGRGKRVAVGGRGGPVEVFRFEEGESQPLPNGFKDVTCAYLSCLRGLIKKFGFPPINFGNSKIDGYIQNSLESVKRAKRKNLPGSLFKLRAAMNWIEQVSITGLDMGNTNATDFASQIGNSGSSCSIELAKNFRNALGQTLLRTRKEDRQVKVLLYQARRQQDATKWKGTVIRSYKAVQVMLNVLGAKTLPFCDASD